MTTAAEAATAVSALSNLGGAGTIGAVVAGAIAILLALKPLLSRIKLSTSMDQGQIDALDRLGQMLNEERAARRLAVERADRFAVERNEAIQKIGKLEGEIHALRADVQRQAAVIEGLRADMERRNAPSST